MSVTGEEIWSFDFSLACSGGCPQSIELPDLMAFEAQGPGTIFCDEQSCGNCRCDAFQFIGTFDEGTWQVQDNWLILSIRATGPVLDFCVNGEEMWLGHVEQGMSYRLRRVECAGTPTPCAMRTAEGCALGGCVLGACEDSGGGTACSELSEKTCETVSGCAWDPMVCTGSAASICEFASCGEPGCEFVDADRPCQGTAEACSTREAATCAVAPGCGLGTCAPEAGVDPRPCSLVSFAQCELVSGCILTGELECIGMAECAAQANPTSCASLIGCAWTASETCLGEATPCAELDPSRCGSQPGCTLAP